MIGERVVINRGDTWEFTIQVGITSGNCAVYFGLMDPHQQFENALVKKKMIVNNSEKVKFVLKASDTLDLEPGIYYYAVKMHKVDKLNNIDEVSTIIDKTKFVIND